MSGRQVGGVERGAGGGGVGGVGVGAGWAVLVGGWGQEQLVGGIVQAGIHVGHSVVLHHHGHHGVVDGNGRGWRGGREGGSRGE